jgi:DNA polymerase (family 10)
MDIQLNGTLDYPDDILAQLDFVIASLHFGLSQDRATITKRLINAINNPHVDMIAHMRGQLIMSREPADLDMDQVFAAAQKTGIAFEINSNPKRLDLEAQYARRAVEMGIPISINTDSHRIEQLANLDYGIRTARRGWVPSERVINTWSLERFREWVGKRGKA